MSDLITELPPGFLEEFQDYIRGTIPEEKVQVELRQARNARIMQDAGSVSVEGLGQKVAEIDARLWFRMQHEAKGDPNWIVNFLADNPQLCAPGYKPRVAKYDVRHGKTFVGGKPV